MDNFWEKRRKIYGVEQIPENMEIIDSTEWAKRNGYSKRRTQDLLRLKRIKYAFKISGKWKIVVPKQR